MVKAPSLRKKKYEAGIDPDKIRLNLLALKPGMVEQESTYFSQISMVESKVKDVVEAYGITPFLVAQYINFGRQVWSLFGRFSEATLAAEVQGLVTLWVSRGLAGPLLIRIAALFGITPTAPPGYPPANHAASHCLAGTDPILCLADAQIPAGIARDIEVVAALVAHAGVAAAHHPVHVATLADHPLVILPAMDDAHIPDVETLSFGGAFAAAQIPTVTFAMTDFADQNLLQASSPTFVNLILTGGLTVGSDIISDAADTDSLGSVTREFRNLYLGNAGRIYFGLAQDVSLYRGAAGWLYSPDRLQFFGRLRSTVGSIMDFITVSSWQYRTGQAAKVVYFEIHNNNDTTNIERIMLAYSRVSGAFSINTENTNAGTLRPLTFGVGQGNESFRINLDETITIIQDTDITAAYLLCPETPACTLANVKYLLFKDSTGNIRRVPCYDNA